MKMPKTLDNLFNNIYFLYFVAFLAVFNVFAYIIMNNFNAIILFILVGYITYLFSKNMAIVLLVALLLTNLFMSSKTNRMGREGMTTGEEDEEGEEQTTTVPSTTTSTTVPATTTSTTVPATTTSTTVPATPTPVPATATPTATPTPTLGAGANINNYQKPLPGPAKPLSGMQNMQNIDLDKLQGLLTQSQGLMKELKSAFPGMGNILGNLGQQ